MPGTATFQSPASMQTHPSRETSVSADISPQHPHQPPAALRRILSHLPQRLHPLSSAASEFTEPDDRVGFRGTDADPPATKLEILTSAHLTRIITFSSLASFTAILYLCVLLGLAHIYSVNVQIEPDFFVDVTIFPYGLLITHIIFSSLIALVLLAVTIFFISSVIRYPHIRTDEQIWTAILLVAAFLHTVPTEDIDAFLLTRFITNSGKLDDPNQILSASRTRFLTTSANTFAAFIFWYIATTAASFRKLSGARSRVSFYLPRAIVLILHVTLRVTASYAVTSPATLALSVFPVGPLFYLSQIQDKANMQNPPSPTAADTRSFVIILSVIIFELLALCWVVRETMVTESSLARVPFAVHRRKHVGWKVFQVRFTVFIINATITLILMSLVPPKGFTVLAQRSGWLLLLSEPFGFGPPVKCLIMIYAVTEAILNLPALVPLSWLGYRLLSPFSHLMSREDQLEIRRKADQRNRESMLTSRQARLRERRLAPQTGQYEETLLSSSPACVTKVEKNSFVLETAARMLNWCYYPYKVTKPPEELEDPYEVWKAREEILDTIRIYDEATDTILVIVRLADRIVASFKGTQSRENFRTDAKVSPTNIESAIGSELAEKIASRAEDMEDVVKARLHSGFAVAYSSVRDKVVRAYEELHNQYPELPWFIVGHSLGGALACLCALHLTLYSEDRTSFAPVQGFSVWTFGCPKLGDRRFVDLLDRIQPTHWRVVNASDIVTQNPPMRWLRHGGTLCLMDRNGNLFVDPVLTITRFIHSEKHSIQMHHLPVYQLSICEIARVSFEEPHFIRRLFWPNWPLTLKQSLLVYRHKERHVDVSCFSTNIDTLMSGVYDELRTNVPRLFKICGMKQRSDVSYDEDVVAKWGRLGLLLLLGSNSRDHLAK